MSVRTLAVIFVAVMLALAWTLTYATLPFPMTITTCKGYVVSKRGDGAIFVRCPGQPLDKPMFSIAAGCCMNPVISNRRETSVTIDCK